MISEEKKNEIEKGAREILNNFSMSLAKVKLSEKKKNHEGVYGFRKEKSGEKCDEDFRSRMFSNAPNKNDRCIIAEKREW